MITSAEPAIATIPAAVSAGVGELGDREAGDGQHRARADQQPPAAAAAAALRLRVARPRRTIIAEADDPRRRSTSSPPITTAAAAAVTEQRELKPARDTSQRALDVEDDLAAAGGGLISSRSGRLSLTSSVTGKISSEPWFGPGRCASSRRSGVGAWAGTSAPTSSAYGLCALDGVYSLWSVSMTLKLVADGPRVVAVFSIDHEHAEVGGARLRGRLADQVLGVLGVVGIEEAGDLDVVARARRSRCGSPSAASRSCSSVPQPVSSRASARAASTSRANSGGAGAHGGRKHMRPARTFTGRKPGAASPPPTPTRSTGLAALDQPPQTPEGALQVAAEEVARAGRARGRRSTIVAGSVQKVTESSEDPGAAPSASSQTV